MMKWVFSLLIIFSIGFGAINGNIAEVSNAALDSGLNTLELFFVLVSAMAVWGGIMRIAEKSGITNKISLLFRVITSYSIHYTKLYEGFERLDFAVGDRAGWLVLPRQPAPGKPWIWRTEFFGHEPQADLALLARGFHVAYLDVQNLYGAPVAVQKIVS